MGRGLGTATSSLALRLIEPIAPSVARNFPSMLPTLRLLSSGSGPKRHAARLFDLWLNAQRTASQGRFDDAVARTYRLLEWTGQWLLCINLGADTGDFRADLLPADVDACPDNYGKINPGLWAAWQVVRSPVPGPARDLIDRHGQEFRDLLSIRNNSILAHGFVPVPQSSWSRMQQWAQDRLLPVLDYYAKEIGIRKPVEQLPTDPPEPQKP